MLIHTFLTAWVILREIFSTYFFSNLISKFFLSVP